VEKMKRINIVGIFPGRPINPEAQKCIRESNIIFSGKRNRELIPETNAQILGIGTMKDFSVELANAFKEGKIITVIASGDPIFFGIGKYITEHYDVSEISIIPEVSSLQVALSRIGMDANNIRTISLHGRPIRGLAQKIRNNVKIALFTDSNNTPSNIAEYMEIFGLKDYTIYIFERLGYSDEKIGKYALDEVIGRKFDGLNIMVLKKNGNNNIQLSDDNAFLRKNDNITKREIREISISELELNNGDTLWDIGSGSGSVAIYASLMDVDGKVYAIEKEKVLCGFIEENMTKFSTDINIINGNAPEALESLPDPDAIFIGGSSGNIKKIFEYSYGRIRRGGRIVANIATLENFQALMEYLKENKLHCEVSQANISRLNSISMYTRFVPLDQIYIIKVRKNELI
jgi:precorrin-6Y C5,15-methyltransferase (decarboxylating)